jgi:hypothetical protein
MPDFQENGCPDGWTDRGAVKSDGGGIGLFGKRPNELTTLCCTTPKEPYATGESDSERQARFRKECAELGGAWYPQWKRCVKPGDQVPVVEGTTSGGNNRGFIQMQRTCAQDYVWSEPANKCVRRK